MFNKSIDFKIFMGNLLYICFFHPYMFPAVKLIQDVEFVDLVSNVADEEVDIVLGYIEAGVAEEFR